VMGEGEACHRHVLHLLLLQLGDHQLTLAPFLLLPHQTHHLAATVIADSKAGSDQFCYCQYHSVVLTCRTLCSYCLNCITQRNLLHISMFTHESRCFTIDRQQVTPVTTFFLWWCLMFVRKKLTTCHPPSA
jgi:hypothetical protein